MAAGILRTAGQPARSDEFLAGLLPGDTYGTSSGLCLCSLACGDVDQAMHWAGSAIGEGMTCFIPDVVRPFESRLRESSGWPALVEAIGLAMRGA